MNAHQKTEEATNLVALPPEVHLQALQHALFTLGERLKQSLPDDERLIITSVSNLVEIIRNRRPDDEVGRSVNTMMTMITSMIEPLRGLVEAGHRQMDEMQEEIETKNALCTTISLECINAEINRREEEDQRISKVQVDLEDEHDTLRDQIQGLNATKVASDNPRAVTRQIEKLEVELVQRKRKIDRIVSGLTANKMFIRNLKQYKASLETLTKGVDEAEFGKQVVKNI